MRMMDEKIEWRDELKATVRGTGLVVASAPLLVGVVIALSIVSGVLPAVVIAQTGKFLNVITPAIRDGAGSIASDEAKRALIILGLAILGGQVLGPLLDAVIFGLQRRFQAYLSRRLMTSVSSLPGLAFHEDPEFRDKLEVAQWVQWGPVTSVRTIANTVQMLIQLVAIAALAAQYAGWVVPLLAVITLPEAVASFREVGKSGWMRHFRSQDSRRASYFRKLALTIEPAKELRVFGLKDWVRERQGDAWLTSMLESWQIRRRSMLIRFGLRFLVLGGAGYVYASMVSATLSGAILIGTFTASSMAVFQLINSLLSVFQNAAQARQQNFYLPTALKLMDLPKQDQRLDVRGTLSAHGLPRAGITFEDVHFAYPGTERVILDGLNLHIPAGQSVALVGENGAGKTTLIKLLCRFYDPTSGRILVDGIDIRELDIVTLRERLAVIFQDFVRYFLAASDNVGFGAVEHTHDREMLRDAAGRVGVLEKLEALPDGWDTPLAREFGGADLSGGEWQRVALARAMMSQIGRDSDLLILDEPTASLDVRLEHELYTHFAELSKGRTTLLVSHRFSTVRMAERIVFLESGRVVEDGTHPELIASGGRYSELYEMQASHFRLTGTLE